MSAMTPPDEDRALSVQTAPKSPGPGPQTGSTPLPAEPLPAEHRKLPKAAARPAPVLALLRARWPWLVIAMLGGTLLGLLMGATQTNKATAVLRLTGVNDPLRVKQVGQTYEQEAMSPPVIRLAVANPDIKGTLPEDLADRVQATWELDTDLVQITVENASGQQAVKEANAVLDAVIKKATTDRDALNRQVKEKVIARLNDPLTGSASAADAGRRDELGKGLGISELNNILDALSVTAGSRATSFIPAGASRPVAAGLGGIGGLLLGGLAALGAGAGRRRVRTPAELRALAPELTQRATTQAGEVAGRLLESGHSTLVVLSLPSTPSSASRFAAAVANHLRTHGSSVTLVNAIALESGDSSSMALPDEVWVLRRDIRQDVKSYFSTDVLVVACTAEPEAVGLISGQSDLMAVVVAKEGRSNLQQIWDTVAAVEAAEPIVVLAP